MRDQDSLNVNIGKICNAKNNTGYPSFPGDIRRAKRIACNMQGNLPTSVLEDGDEDDEGNDGSDDTATDGPVLGG